MTNFIMEIPSFTEEIAQKVHQSLKDYWNGEVIYHLYSDDVSPLATFNLNKKLLKQTINVPMLKEYLIIGEALTEFKTLIKTKTDNGDEKVAVFLAAYYKEYPLAIQHLKEVSVADLLSTSKADLRRIRKTRPTTPPRMARS